jgi:hypothetical protein
MKRFLLPLLIAIFMLPGGQVLARKHVVIHKSPPHASRQSVIPLAAVPPLLIFYDLQRRTSCEGDVLGLGGAGFDASGPQTGNFLIPAVYRNECTPVVAPRRRRH